MSRKRKIIAGAVVVAALGIGTGVAIAASDDHEVPIKGDALTQAKEAALAEVGEGRVTETEVGDEESYYEVEVTKDDGSEVDVQLDRDFNVVGTESDDGDADDAD